MSIAAFDHYPLMPDAGRSSLRYAAAFIPNKLYSSAVAARSMVADTIDWMTNPEPHNNRPNPRPNITWLPSALKNQSARPAMVMALNARAGIGDSDAPAPKAGKSKSVSAKAVTLLSMLVSALAPPSFTGHKSDWSLLYGGSGFGGQFKPDDF